MKEEVTYQEVEPFFEKASTIESGLDKFWFRYAWTVLKDLGLTTVTDDVPRQMIMLRAAGLALIMEGVIFVAYDEMDGHYRIGDILENYIPFDDLVSIDKKHFPSRKFDIDEFPDEGTPYERLAIKTTEEARYAILDSLVKNKEMLYLISVAGTLCAILDVYCTSGSSLPYDWLKSCELPPAVDALIRPRGGVRSYDEYKEVLMTFAFNDALARNEKGEVSFKANAEMDKRVKEVFDWLSSGGHRPIWPYWATLGLAEAFGASI